MKWKVRNVNTSHSINWRKGKISTKIKKRNKFHVRNRDIEEIPQPLYVCMNHRTVWPGFGIDICGLPIGWNQDAGTGVRLGADLVIKNQDFVCLVLIHITLINGFKSRLN